MITRESRIAELYRMEQAGQYNPNSEMTALSMLLHMDRAGQRGYHRIVVPVPDGVETRWVPDMSPEHTESVLRGFWGRPAVKQAEQPEVTRWRRMTRNLLASVRDLDNEGVRETFAQRRARDMRMFRTCWTMMLLFGIAFWTVVIRFLLSLHIVIVNR